MHHILHLCIHLSCDIAMRNPFSQKPTNYSIYVSDQLEWNWYHDFHIQKENGQSQMSNIIVISLEITQNKDRQLLPVLQSHCIDAIVVKAGEICGWRLARLSGQNRCNGRVCGLDFFVFTCSGLLASNIGCNIRLLAFINLYRNIYHLK